MSTPAPPAPRLPLASPEWPKLGTFDVEPRHFPALIQRLLNDAPDPHHPALEDLTVSIFHQSSLVKATYAVFPYLLDIHAHCAPASDRVLYFAANIAAAADPQADAVPDALRLPYEEALEPFERTAVAELLVPGRAPKDVYEATIAAIAFSGHCTRRLWMEPLEAGTEPDSTRFTWLKCTSCDHDFEVRLFDEGLAPGDTATPPSPPRPLSPPLVRELPPRQPNPWQPVAALLSQPSSPPLPAIEQQHVDLAAGLCTAGFGPAASAPEAFSLIGSLLLKHGHAESGRRFLRLWDPVICPKCQAPAVAGSIWWGCR